MLDNPTLNQSPIKIRRALISVFDKTGVVDMAKSLVGLDVEMLSTGGKAKVLRKVNSPVRDGSD